MNILPEIILTLSKEEIRNYKLFIKRTNDNDSRKDELLFDLIKKQYDVKYDEDEVFKKIYDSDNKNPFYRLKNKLQDDIGLSLTFFHFNSTDVNIVLKEVFLAKIFFDKNAWAISKYFLNKAEKRAAEIENYDLLDLIYTEFIKLSHEVLDVDPETYVNKRIQNKKKLDEIRELDNILAVVIYKIRSAQTFNTSIQSIDTLLEEKIKQLATDTTHEHSTQIKLRIYHSISRMLLLKHDYEKLEEYLLKSYSTFEKEKLFNKTNHDTKLQMLTYICNTLFKTKKYQQSLEYSELLKHAINEYNCFLKNKYLYFYYNSLVINYTEVNREKAIQVLNKMFTVKEISTHPVHINYVYLNLSTVYFDSENYKAALKTLIQLINQDTYQNLHESFRIKIELVELMTRYMLKDYEYLETKIKVMLKNYHNLLGESEHAADNDFIVLIRSLAKLNGNIKSMKLQQKIAAYINTYQTQQQTEVVRHIEWLNKFVL